MHMSDALITPIVGGAMLLSSIGVISQSSRKLDNTFIDKRIPYMGVVGAFVFAAQMMNFAIPGTGSSGHIGGGILLAILLGPHAGFITMASILLVQALFFADGGLLAYGCNLINLGFFTCYIAYPCVYKPISRLGDKKPDKRKFYIGLGAVIASVVGLQLGSLGVVIQTVMSGRTDLPFSVFLSFMQPIHLAIGLVEGFITAAVIGYLFSQREDLHYDVFYSQNLESDSEHGFNKKKTRRIIGMVLLVTLLLGGVMSHFASSNPDGLEWSVENTSIGNNEKTVGISIIQKSLESVQKKVAILPDYNFKDAPEPRSILTGTSTSGILGSLLTLAMACLMGVGVRRFKKKKYV